MAGILGNEGLADAFLRTLGMGQSQLNKSSGGSGLTTLPNATQQAVDALKPNTNLPDLNVAISGDQYLNQGVTNDPSVYQTQATSDNPVTSYNGDPNAVAGAGGSGAQGGSGTGGTTSGNLQQQLSDAYNNALRAGSDQAAALQRQALNQAILSNQLQGQLNQGLNTLLQNSAQAQQQSAQVLNQVLGSLKSGKAQTGFQAQDVSAQLEAQQNARKNLRRMGGGENVTKGVGLLAEKALLAKPTLLGS